MTRLVPIASLVLVAALSLQCSSRSRPAPAVDSGRDATMDRFVWQDLVTDDVAASRHFYGSLLGWEFEETTRLGKPYLLVRANERIVAGIASVEREDPNEPIAQWLSYLRVADLDQAVGEFERAGGRILAAPVTLEGVIRAAVVTDALGAALGLVSFEEDVPIEPERSPLQPFLWRDYLAPDVDAALSFYEEVRGYDAERLGQPGERAHYVFRGPRSSSPVGGLVGIGDAPVRASWLPYVKVQDPSALAERASELGGRVLLAPSADVRDGGLAIVADPTGAALALQKWPL